MKEINYLVATIEFKEETNFLTLTCPSSYIIQFYIEKKKIFKIQWSKWMIFIIKSIFCTLNWFCFFSYIFFFLLTSKFCLNGNFIFLFFYLLCNLF